MNISKPFRLALLASGDGTNAEAIIEYFKQHSQISVGQVLSNNAGARVLLRASALEVACRVFDKKQFQETDDVLTGLMDSGITHLVLAGFLWLIPQKFLEAFPHRIINIHPALLPAYGGKGMFGRKVHEAVKAAGEKETGITIHLVNERFDEGKILFQKKCEIASTNSVDDIAKKVRVLEHEYYSKVIEKWVLG